MGATSNRELARRLGVSETAVRRAEKAGRIHREADGAWDLARVRAAAATERASCFLNFYAREGLLKAQLLLR
jgi:DeoR/GlpR family transcriptional regulator of sugar metabolism